MGSGTRMSDGLVQDLHVDGPGLVVEKRDAERGPLDLRSKTSWLSKEMQTSLGKRFQATCLLGKVFDPWRQKILE